MIISPVGTIATGQAAIVAGNVVLKATPSMLCSVLVTTTTTANQAITFIDAATGSSGTTIGVIPGATTAGTVVAFNMPAVLGITILQNAGLAAGAITTSVG